MKSLTVIALVLSGSLQPVLAEDNLEALIAIGQPIYEARCAECHSKGGGGLVGPSFHGNDRIATDAFVIRQITGGGADMPAFGKTLTIDEIVAVGTYIRNSWGNAYGVLSTEATK